MDEGQCGSLWGDLNHYLSFGVKGQVLAWLHDYLTNRTQSLGMTQRLLLISLLSTTGIDLWPSPVCPICGRHWGYRQFICATLHAYTDNAQVYSFCPPREAERL